jgi:hypothetical protein
VATRCTVLIAAPDLLSTLEQRPDLSGGELLAFPDVDALHALDVITQRQPSVVALERVFAATPRGAALIHRIKADPWLRACEIRVVSHDSEFSRTEPRPSVESRGPVSTTLGTPSRTDATLDRGTRRVSRHKVDEFVEVLVDGNLASVVDLSTEGAQVISPTVLKPNQRVRVSLSDEQGVLRFNASVAWASFEIPPNGGPRYRAGIQFLDASGPAVDAYALRHRVS